VKKLRKKANTGQLTKKQLNNRGYNKFLQLTGEVKIEIDESKIEQASRWDGLKGYLTNTKLSSDAPTIYRILVKIDAEQQQL
jgi:hypothetical protein